MSNKLIVSPNNQIFSINAKGLLGYQSIKITILQPQLASHGLLKSLSKELIKNVQLGELILLQLSGTGFRLAVHDNTLELDVALSHTVTFKMPQDTMAIHISPTILLIWGSSIRLVSQVANQIVNLKPVEPYKGKGLRYYATPIKLKETKASKK